MKPLLRKIAVGCKRLWSWVNDLWLGIETSDADNVTEHDKSRPWPFSLMTKKAKHDDGIIYGAAEYFIIRKLIRRLNPGPEEVIFDLGCGKGRVVSLFARWPVKKVVGVELNETHYAVAKRNAERLRGRRCPVQVLCADAALTNLDECTLLFMANPFGSATLREVLQNLAASRVRNPRSLRVVYYLPRYAEVFREFDWLKEAWQMKTLQNDSIVVWAAEKEARPALRAAENVDSRQGLR